MNIDLHCHSTNSDGTWSVESILKLAEARGVEVLSITDHDNLRGSQEAQSKKNGIFSGELIPGIEISTKVLDIKVHLLAYFTTPFIPLETPLLKNLNKIQNSRILRMKKMIKIANSKGFVVTFEDVVHEASKSNLGTKQPSDIISRPHLARVLVQKGYVHNYEDAFNHYLADGKPLHVERFTLQFHDWIKQVKSLGGLIIWAHPLQGFNDNKEKFKEVSNRLADSPIDGVERIYIYGEKYQISDEFHEWGNLYLDKMIGQNNWLITAGGDFHGNVGSLGELDLPKEEWINFKNKLYSNH